MIVYLVRGLPGAGKTTIARMLSSVCLSNDDYWTEPDGTYRVGSRRPAEHQRATADTLRRLRMALDAGTATIAVHNCFVTRDSLEPFKRMANEYGAKVVLVTVQSEFQSVHQVPASVIATMRERWQP